MVVITNDYRESMSLGVFLNGMRYNVPLVNGIKCIENGIKLVWLKVRSRRWTKFK